MSVTVRKLKTSDETEWRRLWRLYRKFYKSDVSEEIYQTLWARLLSDDDTEFKCLVAEDGMGNLVGLTHYLFHRHCRYIENVCYLQDLYVDKSVRGQGAGRALIEAVYTAADESGQARVYWQTQDFNTQARYLYDQVASVTPFIVYQRNTA